jgi:hypothetical protein
MTRPLFAGFFLLIYRTFVNQMKLHNLKQTTFNFLLAVPLASSLQAQSVASQAWQFPWQPRMPISMDGSTYQTTDSNPIVMTSADASSPIGEDDQPSKFKIVSPRNGVVAMGNELVSFMAKIGPWNVKIRSGPGSGFAEVGTIAASQTVQFSAWTFGMTVPDAWTQQPDARWYRIAGTDTWVASAVINGNAPGSRPLP